MPNREFMVANIAVSAIDPTPLLLNIAQAQLMVTPAEFDRLCEHNPDLRLELMNTGELIVMAPAGGESGARNCDLAGQVWFWNRQTSLGKAFDSSTGYDFTTWGGGKLSPDVSWIEQSRLEGIDLTGFIPVVPDFVIELRSATDSLSKLQEKMREYQRLGVKLGLLINPQNQQVEIYQPNQAIEILESPQSIDCSAVMPSFILNFDRIW
jgi:Uma2 family endonuclease